MPLPIAHGLLGASIVAGAHPRPTNHYFTPLFVGAILANAADLDFLLVFIFRSRAWHRGFSHSIAFALTIFLLLLLSLGKERIREAVALGLAFASHALLDYATTKEGGGVELLWPFSSERFALGWVGLSELPSRMPLIEIVKFLVMEFALFVPLLLIVTGLRRYLKKGLDAPEEAR